MTEDEQQMQREAIFEALSMKTAREWDDDERNGLRIMSWSDFGQNAERAGHGAAGALITWQQFKAARRGATICMKAGFTWQTIDGITPRG
jgi:hypothetical protein